MADLALRALHPAFDDVGRIGVAAFQPLAQFVERGRQDKDPDDILSGALVELLCPLPVDIEQHVLPLRQTLLDRCSGRGIAVAEYRGIFQEAVIGDHFFKFVATDEIIVFAMFLAGSLCARGDGDGHRDLLVGFQQHAGERRLAGPRRRGKHEQQAAPVQFTMVIVD